ncbi:sodium channel protein para-like isoform X2 [Centruroides sculpturatus]|uniref:sodium channel protein para-like isoform X2 n=1 Tax=Centruroides sculpturatus TaxID=218467 RepID=UPI000C6CF90C|nr:sodium channel protein para-like isoform X2 [Centruroides sculpturatus]
MKLKNNSKPVMNSVNLSNKIEIKDNKEKEKEIFGNKIHPQKEEDTISNKSINGIKNNKEKGSIIEQPSKENSYGSINASSEEEKKDASKEDLEMKRDLSNNFSDEQNPDVEDIDTDKMETTTADVIISEYPPDCCPDCCYVRYPACLGNDENKYWVIWKESRTKCFRLVENKYFETIVISMILVSSLALALEDVNLKHRPILKDILTYMDKVFTVIFFFEMLIKWLAFGFKQYFTNAWCWLDFVIVLVSVVNLTATLVGGGNIQAFKTMRTLRALRPLRALSRFQGMRVVVNALVQAIPAIFNVLLVCLIFWLIFAIMGVQLFNGKFHKCVDEEGEKLNWTFIPTKDACVERNYTWFNPLINFDNVLNAYLALFQVVSMNFLICYI